MDVDMHTGNMIYKNTAGAQMQMFLYPEIYLCPYVKSQSKLSDLTKIKINLLTIFGKILQFKFQENSFSASHIVICTQISQQVLHTDSNMPENE